MMGIALHSDELPVVKTTNCVLAMAYDELRPTAPTLPCIRCAKCAEVCPVSLLPQQLYWHSRAKDFERVKEYSLFDCIECGCCAFVCPSQIPLVQYYRYAKAEIWAQDRERQKADQARQRYEFRMARLDRESAERASSLAQKKAQVGEGAGAEGKKAAIQAALDRVRAKKRAAEGVAGGQGAPLSGSPEPESSDTAAEQPAIQEAKAD